MTIPPVPLTDTQLASLDLDEIAARAAALYEYATVTDAEGQAALQELTDTDVPALLAEVRRRTAPIALPARWECGHGPADDEPYCAEAEDDGHVCPTIRVHPDDAVQFAALVDEVHRLRAELPPPVVVPGKDTPLSDYDFVELVAFASKVENEGFGYAFEEYPPSFEAPELAPIADDYSLLRQLFDVWEEAVDEFWTRPDAGAVYDAHIDEARLRRREQRAVSAAGGTGE